MSNTHYADLLELMPKGTYFKTSSINPVHTKLEIETPNYSKHIISLICIVSNVTGHIYYETLKDCYGYEAPYMGIKCDEDLVKFIEENDL